MISEKEISKFAKEFVEKSAFKSVKKTEALRNREEALFEQRIKLASHEEEKEALETKVRALKEMPIEDFTLKAKKSLKKNSEEISLHINKYVGAFKDIKENFQEGTDERSDLKKQMLEELLEGIKTMAASRKKERDLIKEQDATVFEKMRQKELEYLEGDVSRLERYDINKNFYSKQIEELDKDPSVQEFKKLISFNAGM